MSTIYILWLPSLHKYIVKNIDKVDVDLKFDEDTIVTTIDCKEAKLVVRTWVDKDRSPEFHNDYNDPQGNSSLSNAPEVQFRVKATLLHYDENEKIKGKNKISFTAMTAAYGGTDGVKLLLKIK